MKGRFGEVRKNVLKEIQRIETYKLKSYRSLIKKANDETDRSISISLYKKALTFRKDDEKNILNIIDNLEKSLNEYAIIELKDSKPIKLFFDMNNLVLEQENDKGKFTKSYIAIPPSKNTTDIFWIDDRITKTVDYEHNSKALIIMRGEDVLSIYFEGNLILKQ